MLTCRSHWRYSGVLVVFTDFEVSPRCGDRSLLLRSSSSAQALTLEDWQEWMGKLFGNNSREKLGFP